MKQKILKFFAIAVLIFQVCSCEKDDPESIAPQGASLHTSLIYLVADNNLSSYAATDIEEMIKGYEAVEDAENNNLLVYMDDKNAPRLMKIKRVKGRIVTDLLHTYPEQNSLDIEVMGGVINEALSLFKAESYGLVLWSHADGWLPGTETGNTISSKSFGEDSNNWSSSGTRMDILDLKAALELGPKLEYLVFDACDMQAIEVAYELRYLTDYVIASPVEVSAYGAPYEDVVPALFATSNPAENIAEAFFRDYANNYDSSSGDAIDGANKSKAHLNGIGKGSAADYPFGIAISVIKTAGIEELAAATKAILTKDPENASVKTDGILSYDNNYYNFYYDLGGLVQAVAEPGSAELANWKTIFSEVVPVFLTTAYTYSSFADAGRGAMRDMGPATGVSTFIPGNSDFSKARHWGSYLDQKPDAPSIVEDYYSYYQEYYKNFEWYSAAGWKDLLE